MYIYIFWGLSQYKDVVFTSIGIPMLKTSIGTRWSHNCLIFNMGIPIPGKDICCIETGPWSQGVNPIFQYSVKIYLYFVLFCDTEMAWIMKILPHGRQSHIDRTASKVRKNIYRSKLQDTVVLYGHFQMFVGPLLKKSTFTKYCLTQWISKLLGSFEIHWVRQYMVNFMGLAGIVYPTVYKTKPIFTGFGHCKLS